MSMDKFPVASRKRLILESGIRVIDIVIYLSVFAGGIYALLFTPESVKTELAGFTWLVPYWAAFLLIGGALGAIGRITTFWLLEPPATVAASVGMLIYLVVLVNTAFTSLTAAVACSLVLVALLNVTRRYLELQLFGSNPAASTPRDKFNEVWERRIPNVPPRE